MDTRSNSYAKYIDPFVKAYCEQDDKMWPELLNLREYYAGTLHYTVAEAMTAQKLDPNHSLLDAKYLLSNKRIKNNF